MKISGFEDVMSLVRQKLASVSQESSGCIFVAKRVTCYFFLYPDYEGGDSTEGLVNLYQTARRHIPEEYTVITAMRTSNLFTPFICISLCVFRTMF
jgi:hypothetical protein